MPTEMEDYLFDLQGYLILKQAVDQMILGKYAQPVTGSFRAN